MTGTRRGVWGRDEQGATIVEFALLIPVVILLLVVCLDFGRALNAYVTVTNASREGARYASVHPDGPGALTAVETYLKSRIAPLAPEAFHVRQLKFAPTTDAGWNTLSPVPGTVTLSVAYDWQAVTWLAGSFFSAATQSRTFEASSSMETVR